MSAERWDRLQADLKAEGIQVQVDAHQWSESLYGRVEHGTSRSITILRQDRGPVVIRDTWFRDKWTGWHTSGEDTEGIETYSGLKTKTRSEVVFDVLICLGRNRVSA